MACVSRARERERGCRFSQGKRMQKKPVRERVRGYFRGKLIVDDSIGSSQYIWKCAAYALVRLMDEILGYFICIRRVIFNDFLVV